MNKIDKKINSLIESTIKNFIENIVVKYIAGAMGFYITYSCTLATIYTNKPVLEGFFPADFVSTVARAMGFVWVLYCFTKFPKFKFLSLKFTAYGILFISSMFAVGSIQKNSIAEMTTEIKSNSDLLLLTESIQSNKIEIEDLRKQSKNDSSWYYYYKFIEKSNSVAKEFRILRQIKDSTRRVLIAENVKLKKKRISLSDSLKKAGGSSLSAVTYSALAVIPILNKLPVKSQNRFVFILVSFINDISIRFGSTIVLHYFPFLIIPIKNEKKRRKRKFSFARLVENQIYKLPFLRHFKPTSRKIIISKKANKKLERVYCQVVNTQSDQEKILLNSVGELSGFVEVGQNGRIIREKKTDKEGKIIAIGVMILLFKKLNLPINHSEMSRQSMVVTKVDLKRSTISTYYEEAYNKLEEIEKNYFPEFKTKLLDK